MFDSNDQFIIKGAGIVSNIKKIFLKSSTKVKIVFYKSLISIHRIIFCQILLTLRYKNCLVKHRQYILVKSYPFLDCHDKEE